MSRTVCLAVLLAIVGAALTMSGFCTRKARAQSNDAVADLQKKAASVLRGAMHEGKAFEKVHAAEALIWSGQPEGVREFFLEQDRTASSEPLYRIGIWRALYRASAGDPAAQETYFQKIVAVFSDAKAGDRGTAAETLGKLKYAGHTDLVQDLADHGKDDIRISARWILANSGKAEDEAYLAECLRSRNPKDRLYAAYALRHLSAIRPPSLNALRDLAAQQPTDAEVQYYALGALYVHLPPDQRESVRRELLKYAATGNTDQRYEACMALANAPTEDMIPVVENLLNNKPLDERIGGAYVLLRMPANK